MRLLPILLLVVAGFAWLQVQSRTQAQDDPAALLSRARQAASEARETYEVHISDRPLWSEAIRLANRAQALAPDDLDVLRFRALIHTEVRWFSRAYSIWLEYLEAGGELSATPQEQDEGLSPAEAFAEAGNQLGYARYSAGNHAAALGYYETVLRELPENEEALYWLGLINLQLDEEEAARSYFERLVDANPDHQTARDYLTIIAEREQVGDAASQAYRDGLSAYEEGRTIDAYERFQEALSHNANFTDAAVWAGRTALELENPQAAVDYWSQVVEARPEDSAARYFLDVARTQAEYGVIAGRAFQDGQSAYEQGDLEAAAEAFGTAVETNPTMTEAWEWAARTRQELGEPELAEYYWEGVLERRPGDETVRYYLDLARQQSQFGVEAGRAFAEAVQHYQMAEFDEAEEQFQRAVELNPELAAAWGWLGRLYFTRGNYQQAAEAYGRAHELAPSNDDYAFFAQEAELLTGEGN